MKGSGTDLAPVLEEPEMEVGVRTDLHQSTDDIAKCHGLSHHDIDLGQLRIAIICAVAHRLEGVVQTMGVIVRVVHRNVDLPVSVARVEIGVHIGHHTWCRRMKDSEVLIRREVESVVGLQRRGALTTVAVGPQQAGDLRLVRVRRQIEDRVCRTRPSCQIARLEPIREQISSFRDSNRRVGRQTPEPASHAASSNHRTRVARISDLPSRLYSAYT